MTMEQLMKLISKLETKQEDRYENEDGYSFAVTTPKCLYKVDVIVDRGEFMNVSIDIYQGDNRLLFVEWDLNWYDFIKVKPFNELGDKLFNALIARL